MKISRHWVRFGEFRDCPQHRCKGTGEILAPLNRLEDPYLFFCTRCARVVARDTGESVTQVVVNNTTKEERLDILSRMHSIEGHPKYGWKGELLNV